MQKRGVMIDADDYAPVTGTYPHMPHEIVPKATTMTELKTIRHEVEKKDIKSKKDAKDQAMAKAKEISFKDYYRPQEFVEQPTFNATWEKKAALKRKQRHSVGLT